MTLIRCFQGLQALPPWGRDFVRYRFHISFSIRPYLSECRIIQLDTISVSSVPRTICELLRRSRRAPACASADSISDPESHKAIPNRPKIPAAFLIAWIADKYGRKAPIFIGSILMFAGSLAGAFCHTRAQLIGSRILLGVGTASGRE